MDGLPPEGCEWTEDTLEALYTFAPTSEVSFELFSQNRVHIDDLSGILQNW